MTNQRKTISNTAAFSLVAEMLHQGETVRISVQGQSMLPFFQSGSSITLRPIQEGDIQVGHVVLGETTGNHFVVHRIIKVEEKKVILLGDGNVIGTETIPKEKIHGIVDCGKMHLLMARIWRWMRPVRKYPLWFLRRICKK